MGLICVVVYFAWGWYRRSVCSISYSAAGVPAAQAHPQGAPQSPLCPMSAPAPTPAPLSPTFPSPPLQHGTRFISLSCGRWAHRLLLVSHWICYLYLSFLILLQISCKPLTSTNFFIYFFIWVWLFLSSLFFSCFQYLFGGVFFVFFLVKTFNFILLWESSLSMFNKLWLYYLCMLFLHVNCNRLLSCFII